MKFCIHRGASEIGGNCVEIESQGKRIVLDIGLPLDAGDEDVPLPPVRGFAQPDESLLGVIISHPHQDHCGLAHKLPPGTPLLIGGAAIRILAAANVFAPVEIAFRNVLLLKDRVPITLGPFTVTPFLMDHSAYDAYAILVEADGKRLFYTGDFRGHGRKGVLLDRLLANPPRDIEVLMIEGTTIGRATNESVYPTEGELEGLFEELFVRTAGLSLVWSSGQNVDRLVTLYRAARHAGKRLIVDMYTASILMVIENPRLPQPGFPGFRVFLPNVQKYLIVRKRLFKFATLFRQWRIFPEDLAAQAADSVMRFRPSMAGDLQAAGCLDGARLTYSLWPGYLQETRQKPFWNWLWKNNIQMVQCHTSGHASVPDLRRMAKALAPRIIVPIHSREPQSYAHVFGKSHVVKNGQWVQF